jgi:hypothetical protein
MGVGHHPLTFALPGWVEVKKLAPSRALDRPGRPPATYFVPSGKSLSAHVGRKQAPRLCGVARCAQYASHKTAVIVMCHSVRRGLTDMGAIQMRKMTSAQLFGGPQSMRKVNARLARAQLLTAGARERAIELARKYENSPLGKRTVAHRRRVAQLQMS